MTPSNEDLEREFERLLRDPLTRRHIMKRGAAGVLSASALAYLAACGTDEPSGGNGKKAEGAKPIAKGKIASAMYIANWPLYIDEEARRRLPTAGDGARLTWSTENIHIVREGQTQSDTE